MKKKLALFTSQFPAMVSTFFARDLYILISNGFEVDVFPVHPIQDQYWDNVPSCIRETIKKQVKILFVNPLHFSWNNLKLETLNDIQLIMKESLRYGPLQTVKSLFVIQQAIMWARRYDGKYDYLLSYWGNYAATYSYVANTILKNKLPFSFFLHAGTDLYRDRIFLEQKILSANKVFTVCDFNRAFLQKTYPKSFDKFKNKLIIYHLGIDLKDTILEKGARDSGTLLTVGFFSPQKGFSTVIKAISLLGKGNKIKLIMIGDGPEKKNLMKLVKNLEIEDRVEFTGWLPYDEVKKFMAKCTILIHPSSDLGDAVPTVIKEALAAGLPVIGANIAGIPELLDYGNVGLLFPPKESVGLANAIQTLLVDHNLQKLLSIKGRTYAERKFDMWKNGKILLRQIESDLQ